MRAVQDLLFLETLDFEIAFTQGLRCLKTTPSMGAAARQACDLAGIELIDYDSVLFVPHVCTQKLRDAGVAPFLDVFRVQLRSKAWRERVERQAGTPGR